LALPQYITTNETGEIFIGTDDPRGANVGGVLVASDGEIDDVALTILIGLAGDGFIVLNCFYDKSLQNFDIVFIST
jgi:hypothetical protein